MERRRLVTDEAVYAFKAMTNNLPIKLEHLPKILPLEGAVRIELIEEIPIFRASEQVITIIETLLIKQKESNLTSEEENELDGYEELDDYLNLVNRIIRNHFFSSMRNTVIHYENPFEPATPLEDWEALQ
ncbi:MAG: hypothetical protein WBF90_23845 [Rivularia sp. (in: cyanobacteria)]